MREAAFFIGMLAFIPMLSFGLDIKGRVVSSQGRPVRAAVVFHRASGQRAVTDDGGNFMFAVPASGDVVLEIIHPDYLELEIRLIAQDLSRPLTITLEPYIRQREEVVVTAVRYPEPSTEVPAASTVVSAVTLQEAMSPNIAEALAVLPGVAELGSGGFSLVPSIRGLARRRVLLMVDNARLSSDRRTGPSASFVSPEDIERIEVLRSPSSVFYGSDAIGGVVHILTREPDGQSGLRGKVNTRYGTVNQEKGLGLSLTGGRPSLGFFLSFQGVEAGNYRSPDAEVLQSRYGQASVLGKLRHQSKKRDVIFSFLLARGRDIGKPNRDSATKPTWYPRENQNLLQFHWQEKEVWADGELSLHIFANPNFLETRTDTFQPFKSKASYSKTASTDYGLQLSFAKRLVSGFRLTAGLDWYGRAGAAAVNSDEYLGEQGGVVETFEEHPYTGGLRRDFGVFLSGDYNGVRGLDLVAGVRFDFLQSRAHPGGGEAVETSDQKALTGFLAASYKLSEKIVFFANISRAYRAPDLNELYYTGITGRGFIISNPALTPESSLSYDTGLKYLGRRHFLGLYGFSYTIADMIERYRIEEKIYTYGNIEKGRVRGLELEWEFFPWTGFSLFGNVAAIEGQSLNAGVPLNDIPPCRLQVGGRAWLGRLSLEVNGTWQQKKDNPGPAEIAIPSAHWVNFKSSYFLAPSIHFYFVLSNCLGANYLARPDPDSMPAPGRNFHFAIAYSF
ncbi:MAG: TonB-dependent receptor [Candidatus Aminicenantales bacterium]